MPERNVELLEKTMQQILDNPELHNQGSYFIRTDCGTAACFAGWARLLCGLTEEEIGWSSYSNRVVNGHGAAAVKLLGITEAEGANLFDASNTVGMLQLMVKDLVNGDELRHYREYAVDDNARGWSGV